MKNKQGKLIIKHFESPNRKNEYLLISGSTFLKGGFGKIWGPISMERMHASLKRLSSTIPDDATIYTGSGEWTKLKNAGWINRMCSA